MNYTKVLGKCLNPGCSKKASGKCQNFSAPGVGEQAWICSYCGCHEGTHELRGHVPLPIPVVAPKLVAPSPVKGPTLEERKRTREERSAVFKKNSSPSPKKKSKTANFVTEVPAAAPLIPPRPAPRPPPQDTPENRMQDRLMALQEAPEGCTKTDMDMLEYFTINDKFWMPPVAEEDTDVVTDFRKYCFSCKTQLPCADREQCQGRKCGRFMFVHCGMHGPILETEWGDTDPEYNWYTAKHVPDDYFRCCDCKDMLTKTKTFERDQLSFDRADETDFVEPESPSRPRVSRFSSDWN